jgi:D-glycero-D-manno-heptose 1,7-bisphosphate phosphatase
VSNRTPSSEPGKFGKFERAVFLDRDGTIIEEVGYLDRPERVEFFPWTIDAVRVLNSAGLAVVLVSNQSGVARGFFTETIVDEVHQRMATMLAEGGARIDRYYYCPHHPDGKVPEFARTCDCRKPGRGLVDRAARELGIDPARSFVVGDRWLDVALGRAIGAQAVLVRTGYGAGEEKQPGDITADAVVDNLIAASSWILGRL